MLVLTRKKNEEILLFPGTPHEIRVMIVDIRGDNVRLGFKMPKDVVAHRAEVWEDIQRNGQRRNF